MTGIRPAAANDEPVVGRQSPARCPGLEIPDGGQRREAIHVGHLEVHQHEIEVLAFERLQRGPPGPGHHDRMSLALHQPDGQPLVHDVVLRQQDAETMSTLPEHVTGHEVRRLARPGQSAGGRQDRLEQLSLRDRRAEVSGDADRAAPGGVPGPAGGREHDQGRPGVGGLGLDPLAEREAVDLRNLRVGQHQREGGAAGARALDGGQRRRCRCSPRWARCPSGSACRG